MTNKIYFPNLALALEYQGELHYYSTRLFGPATGRQRADQLKMRFATDMGITLIPIPFWWNRTTSSLASTISATRPDLHFGNLSKDEPISKDMPKQLIKQFKYTPNTSIVYHEGIDPTGWYVIHICRSKYLFRLMMEKLDGVRVFWDGKGTLKAKDAKIYVPPELKFPVFPFEGELS
jgi:hypothetical protein